MLVGREGQSREARETALRCFRDEGTPGVNPSTGGRGVRKPGIIGSEDDILLPPNASEGGTGSELDEIVNTGDSAGRARPGVRGVGAVVLATLQKGAVRAGRDDRADITLGKSGGRARDTPRETKEDAERILAEYLSL